MGTHGGRGLERSLLGSTTERVVRRSSVPVPTVRAGGKTVKEENERETGTEGADT